MQSFAWMEESEGRQLRTYLNFVKVLEVDAWGRPGRRPCFNNPDYRNWHLGFVEDYLQSYQLDGLAWCSERPGPLNMLMQGTVDVAEVGLLARTAGSSAVIAGSTSTARCVATASWSSGTSGSAPVSARSTARS